MRLATSTKPAPVNTPLTIASCAFLPLLRLSVPTRWVAMSAADAKMAAFFSVSVGSRSSRTQGNLRRSIPMRTTADDSLDGFRIVAELCGIQGLDFGNRLQIIVGDWRARKVSKDPKQLRIGEKLNRSLIQFGQVDCRFKQVFDVAKALVESLQVIFQGLFQAFLAENLRRFAAILVQFFRAPSPWLDSFQTVPLCKQFAVQVRRGARLLWARISSAHPHTFVLVLLCTLLRE